MKSKNEGEFWDSNKMYEYAMQIYPIPDSIKDDWSNREKAIKKIKRTFEDFHLQTTKVGDNGHEKYQVHVYLAKYIVEDILYDYFMQNSPKIEERRAKREEQHRQKVLADMEIKSLEDDKQKAIATGSAEIVNVLYDEIKTNPNFDRDGKIQSKIESSKWKSENFYKLSDNSDVLKKNFEYHIPDLSVDELDNETVERVIDRMMIRAIFDLFYDFKEKDFRMALYERAAHIEEINEGGVKPVSGYSELSRRLENPLGFYITKKDF